MKKFLFIAVLLCCSFFSAQSQDYRSAIGLRLGYPTSISLKHFTTNRAALEGYVGFRRWKTFSYTNVGFLYQIHNNIGDINGLRWYYGAGASAYLWRYDDIYKNDNYNNVNIGVSGALGLDFKFPDAPINISLDWVPTFVIGDAYYKGFRGDYGALSVRYIFK